MIHPSSWTGRVARSTVRQGGRWWALRPPLRRVRQREPERGQVVIGRIPVDAVPLGVALHRDRRPGADPRLCRVPALPLAHPVPTRLHARDFTGGQCPSYRTPQDAGSHALLTSIATNRPSAVGGVSGRLTCAGLV